jgi:hypothetical protein
MTDFHETQYEPHANGDLIALVLLAHYHQQYKHGDCKHEGWKVSFVDQF